MIKTNSEIRLAAIMAIMSAMCCGMLGLRIFLSGQTTYLFLIWNLFLALIPLVLGLNLYALSKKSSQNTLVMVLLGPFMASVFS
ncbi:hypothetical protein RCC89_12745 [Cytophagaceae bacterium ABcell3]|nr:hypothetical protein RCC89_12745 [Cytophagaceae bacterium ABcell3]